MAELDDERTAARLVIELAESAAFVDWTDRDRVRGLLADAPLTRPTRARLMHVSESRQLEVLQRHPGLEGNMRVVDHLTAEYGLSADTATWAVRVWRNVLSGDLNPTVMVNGRRIGKGRAVGRVRRVPPPASSEPPRQSDHRPRLPIRDHRWKLPGSSNATAADHTDATVPRSASTAPPVAKSGASGGVQSVLLSDAGKQKIHVIKVVRELTALGLKEAKDLVDGVPSVVLANVSATKAVAAKSALEAAGGTVELRAPTLLSTAWSDPAATPVPVDVRLVTVVLSDAGKQKIQMIKVVRELTALGLKEAKDLVDGVPSVVLANVHPTDATAAKWALEKAGGTVGVLGIRTPTPRIPPPALPIPSEGWYGDPSGRFDFRFWDGNGWTEHVSRVGAVLADPPLASFSAPRFR